MLKTTLIHAAILSICQCIYASNITFNVIHSAQHGLQNYAVNGRQDNRMAVRFEGNSTFFILDNQNTPDSLIHTGSLDAVSSRYQYVIVDHEYNVVESEPFFRTQNPSILYEFYGRPITQFQAQHLSAISFPDDYPYKVGLDRTAVHPNDEIPTWHLHVSNSQLMHDHILDDIGITGNMTRISAHHIDHFNNARLELSGHTSRLFKKLTYSIRFDDSLNGYQRFKIRSCATDPSYMREKLYYDILESMHVPTAKASYIRLFINDEPQGLYLVVDHYKHPFFKNVFGSGKENYKTGALVQGSMQENPLAVGKLKLGANLAYLGKHVSDYYENKTSAYEVKETAHGRNPMKDLVSFLKFVHETNKPVKSKKEETKRVSDWYKRFDVTLFLKHLALELILGHGDGYMGAAHNYMLYQDLDQKGKFIWIASDLDQTMGNTLKATQEQSGTKTLADLFDRFGTFHTVTERPLVDSLLKVQPFQKRFEQILLDVRRSLLKGDQVIHYITYLKELIERDVQWDQQLEPYRIDNFANNKTLYESLLYDKVVQLPLGKDFIHRIDEHSINFTAAIQEDIDNHPSITSLFSWFRNLEN